MPNYMRITPLLMTWLKLIADLTSGKWALKHILANKLKKSFSAKSQKKIAHPPLFFNNIQVSQSSSHKHLGVILDERIIFCEHLKNVAPKINKTIRLLRKLQSLLRRSY